MLKKIFCALTVTAWSLAATSVSATPITYDFTTTSLTFEFPNPNPQPVSAFMSMTINGSFADLPTLSTNGAGLPSSVNFGNLLAFTFWTSGFGFEEGGIGSNSADPVTLAAFTTATTFQEPDLVAWSVSPNGISWRDFANSMTASFNTDPASTAISLQIGTDGGLCVEQCQFTGYWAVAAVPEPEPMLLFLAGLAIMMIGSWISTRSTARRSTNLPRLNAS